MKTAKLIIFAILVMFFCAGSSFAQDSVIEGRLILGTTPVGDAEIELYIGKEKKPLDKTHTDKDGAFRFEWKNVDFKADIKPEGNVELRKERIGRNRWKITITEAGSPSFFERYRLSILGAMGPIVGFALGVFSKAISDFLSNLCKRRKLRKYDFEPLEKRLASLFSEIRAYVENGKFTEEMVDEYDKNTRKVVDEMGELLERETQIVNYDRESWAKLKVYRDDFSFLCGFLGNENREHQKVLSLYFGNKERAENEYPGESSHFSSIETSLSSLLAYRNNK